MRDVARVGDVWSRVGWRRIDEPNHHDHVLVSGAAGGSHQTVPAAFALPRSTYPYPPCSPYSEPSTSSQRGPSLPWPASGTSLQPR